MRKQQKAPTSAKHSSTSWNSVSKNISDTQIENPASEYCIQQGGKLVQTTLPEGEEYQNCKLPNGEEIEERKLYHSAPYLGKTIEEAQDLAKQNGVELRIIEQDGQALETSADYSPGRINASLKNWIITSAFEE